MHPQKKGLFSWFSIFQIRVSFNIFEIELAVSREITIELQFFFFPQEMEVMFSENRGHSVYCGVDKPLILLFPACLFDMEFEFLHAVRTVHWDSQLPGRGSLTGPWHVKPTCPKPSSFVFLPDLLLQEAHAQVGGPCYSSPFLASCSMSQQSQPAGLRACVSLSLFMMPLLS